MIHDNVHVSVHNVHCACTCTCSSVVRGSKVIMHNNYSHAKESLAGVYLEIFWGGGNMVDKDSKKGHNTLLCTVGTFATNFLTPVHRTYMYLVCY